MGSEAWNYDNEQPTDRPTDGHEGSKGSFTSNDKLFLCVLLIIKEWVCLLIFSFLFEGPSWEFERPSAGEPHLYWALTVCQISLTFVNKCFLWKENNIIGSGIGRAVGRLVGRLHARPEGTFLVFLVIILERKESLQKKRLTPMTHIKIKSYL